MIMTHSAFGAPDDLPQHNGGARFVVTGSTNDSGTFQVPRIEPETRSFRHLGQTHGGARFVVTSVGGLTPNQIS